MTAYEIADLRASLGARTSMLLSMWFTATFALFAATFAAGARLDWGSILALLFFYLAVTFIVNRLIVLAQSQMDALATDAEKISRGADRAAILAYDLVASPQQIRIVGGVIFWTTYAGFVFFVFNAAGYFS
jgi:hypothetical protein